MPTIQVVSKRVGGTQPAAGSTIVYIGRPSVLGNPFAITAACPRAQSIALYKEWLLVEYGKRGAVYAALHDLARRAKAGEQLALQCWCAPDPCHGHVLQEDICAIAGIA